MVSNVNFKLYLMKNSNKQVTFETKHSVLSQSIPTFLAIFNLKE